LFETRRGIEQHFLLATTSGDYILRIFLAAHDDRTLKQLESSFEHVVFFAPADLHRYVMLPRSLTMGLPSLPSAGALEADPPPSASIRQDQWRLLRERGHRFSYRIPQGWTLEAEGAVQRPWNAIAPRKTSDGLAWAH